MRLLTALVLIGLVLAFVSEASDVDKKRRRKNRKRKLKVKQPVLLTTTVRAEIENTCSTEY